MPKDVDIQPGQAFHLPASQDKNLDNLLKIFSKKEATEALTEIAKVDKSTWQDIQSTVSDLKQISTLGGVSTIVESLSETIDLKIRDILSPLTNEINTLIAEALAPIEATLSDIFNELGTFVAENKTGAAVGGIAGSIAAMFLPGGPIIAALVTALGAVVGAQLENLLLSLLAAETPEEVLGGTEDLLSALPFPGIGLGFGLGAGLLDLFF